MDQTPVRFDCCSDMHGGITQLIAAQCPNWRYKLQKRETRGEWKDKKVSRPGFMAAPCKSHSIASTLIMQARVAMDGSG